MEKKISFSIKDIIYIVTIAAGIAGHFISKAKWETAYLTKQEILIENDKKNTEYWYNQNGINQRFLTYMQLAPDQSGTQEEDSQEGN